MSARQLKVSVTEEKFLTSHPAGKSGRNVSKEKYDLVKTEILSLLKRSDLSHTALLQGLNRNLKGRFTGNVNWYGEIVKLDLEARRVIERTGTKPEKYRVVKI